MKYMNIKQLFNLNVIAAKKRTLGITVFAAAMITSGLVMVIYCMTGLFKRDPIVSFISEFYFLQPLFWYFLFPKSIIPLLLSMRFILALSQIVIGILALHIKFEAIACSRWLILFGLLTAVINPFYPAGYIFLSLLIYGPLLFYLYYYRVENLFRKGVVEDDEGAVAGTAIHDAAGDPESKSRFVLLVGITELILGFFLVRFSFWNIPITGWELLVPTRIGFEFSMMLPKALILFLGVLIITAGLRTIIYKPLGRILTIFLGFLAAIISVLCIIVINPAKLAGLKPFYGVLIVFLSVFTASCFVIMSNPKVKIQFTSAGPLTFTGKMKRFGVVCLASFAFSFIMHLVFETFPNFFTGHYAQINVSKSRLLSKYVSTEEKEVLIDNADQQQVFTLNNEKDQALFVKEVAWKNLGKKFLTLYREQQYKEAEDVGKEALKAAEEIYGPEDFNVTVSLNNLGLLYFTMRRYPESEQLLNRALAINQKIFGNDNARVATDLNNVAEVYRVQKKYDDAIFLYNRAIKIMEKHYGKEHVAVKILKENLVTLMKEKEINKNTTTTPLPTENIPTQQEPVPAGLPVHSGPPTDEVKQSADSPPDSAPSQSSPGQQ